MTDVDTTVEVETLESKQEISEDNATQAVDVEIDKDLELNSYEREYLITAVSYLEDATPRKIRIFYYKYLLSKQLMHIKLLEENLMKEWEESCNEKILIDTLIKRTNGTGGLPSHINPRIVDVIDSCTEMVCVL